MAQYFMFKYLFQPSPVKSFGDRPVPVQFQAGVSCTFTGME